VIAVDASAVLAILLGEPEGAQFEALLLREGGVMTAVNYWEVLVRANKAAGTRGRDVAETLMARLGIEIRAASAEDARRAVEAFERFGRGTQAGLNLGDCFAYALAAAEGDGLLYKGDDFPRTDTITAGT
jgi:ribonuclease VapC